MSRSRRPIVRAAGLLPLVAWRPAQARRPLHRVFVERLRELGGTEGVNLH